MKAFSKFMSVLVVAAIVIMTNPMPRFSAEGLIHGERFVDWHPVSYWVAQTHSSESSDRFAAVNALARSSVRTRQVADALIERCSDYDFMVKMSAIEAIGTLGLKSPAIHSALLAGASDVNFLVRTQAASALRSLYGQSSQPLLYKPLTLQ